MYHRFQTFLQANVAKIGLKALDVTLEFDEKNVLETNIEYLLHTLEVMYMGKQVVMATFIYPQGL